MGRPRRYNEPALLDAARELFWSNGYERTSVDDVSAASGISNGSIYAAYGSKMGLFLVVFERYCNAKAEFVESVFRDAPGTAASAIHTYFEEIIADCASQPDRRGCLMLNSIAELGLHAVKVLNTSAAATKRMEASVTQRLRHGVDTTFDHLGDAETSALSAHVVLVSQGLIHLSRLGTPTERLREVAEISCAALPYSRAA